MFSHWKDIFFKRLRIKGKNNNISYHKNDKGIISINGNNNIVSLPKSAKSFRLVICGNNNKIIAEDNVLLDKVNINIGKRAYPVENCEILIGKNTFFGQNTKILIMESNSALHIGKDCLFAENANIWCTDAHAILDQKGNATNIGKSIEIGDHVWVGMDVKIGKNTQIMKDSIVGWNSVVSRKFDESNVVIAGNPASIVKRGVSWDEKPVQVILNQNNK